MKIRRLIAIYIDLNLIGICQTRIITFFNYFLEYAIKLNEKDIASIVFYVIYTIIWIIITAYIIISKDCIIGFESIGKKIMRLKIFDEENELVTNRKLLQKRNLESLKYFVTYPFMILIKNQSAGDEKYNTHVIEY